MKKILSLLVVLSLATVANASFFDLSVDGEIAGDEIWLQPSDTIVLDVYFNDNYYMGGDLLIQLSNAQGELDPTGYTFINPVPTEAVPGYPPFDMEWEAPWQLLLWDPQSAIFSGGNMTNNTVGPYTLLDNILFHCVDPTDVILELIAYSDQVYKEGTEMTVIPGHTAGTVLDTLVIHQPEPATIALLGLGGLFLRRRRR